MAARLSDGDGSRPLPLPSRLPYRGRGEQGERGETGEARVPADRHAVGGGEPDAKPGKAARAAADQDVRGGAARHQIGDHRHQMFGMPATDREVARTDQRAVGIEQRGGAGGAAGIKREGQGGRGGGHGRILVTGPSSSQEGGNPG